MKEPVEVDIPSLAAILAMPTPPLHPVVAARRMAEAAALLEVFRLKPVVEEVA